MGDRSAEVLKITIILIAFVAVMVLGFVTFSITKSQANVQTNSLVVEMGEINNLNYNSLNQSVVNGSVVKSTIKDLQSKDASVILITKYLLGSELAVYGGKNESSINGSYGIDFNNKEVPLVVLENFSLSTPQGTKIEKPLAVNYGTILKNSVLGYDNENEKIESILQEELNYIPYDESVEYGQSIQYKDGVFYTKSEFLTDKNGNIKRYDRPADYNEKGTTMYISDNSTFYSYLLKNISGEILGVVFIQD